MSKETAKDASGGKKRESDKPESDREPEKPAKRVSPKPRRHSDPPPEESAWSRTLANLKTIGGAVLLAIFIRIVLFEAFEIEGPSMEPTLLNGDRVVVAKFSYGLFLPFAGDAVLTWGEPSAGEVIIVKSPHDDIDIVKRVVGVPGDTIEVRDDVVFRNGDAITERDLGPCEPEPNRPTGGGTQCVLEAVGDHSYRTSHDIASPPSNQPPTTVPDDHVFILGDHRDRSNDSRFFGVVPISRVKGKAMVIYWSNDTAVRWDRLFEAVD